MAAVRALSASWRTAVSWRAVPSLTAASGRLQQRRNLNIHESYAFEIMRRHGISVPKYAIANTPAEARLAASRLGDEVVVKAQVLAGGRGKGKFDNGMEKGVQLVSSEKVGDVAANMIGHRLITKQTGEGGRPCNKVLIVEKRAIAKEFYFAILMDRAAQGPVVVASSEGGMDIEAVAEKHPDAIVKMPIDIETGFTKEQAESVAEQLGFPGHSKELAAEQMTKLYDMFMKNDCTLVEINPMVMDADGQVLCLDAKVNMDDNAAFRQKTNFGLRDESQENPLDVEAAKADLNYIGLEGSIGCLVNGAGLAMATMDIIQLHGGKPANFLDIGGGATREQVLEAFKIITSDPQVCALLVNIFGGIMRCDIIAEGIIAATRELDLQIPIVVRLQGTRKEEAHVLIEASALDLIPADDLGEAAKRAVQVAQIVTAARQAGLRVSLSPEPTKRGAPDREILSL